MDVTRFVDTSGDMPSVKLGLLASTLLGTVVYGWLNGLVDFVDTVLGGVASIPDRLGSFSIDVIDAIFQLFDDVVGTAWQSNAEYLAGLGWLGVFAAIVEIAVVMFVVMLVVERLIRFVRVVTP